MLKIAVPNKGSLSERAMEILAEAGYAGRGDSKSLNVFDEANNVEFFFLRPKDIAIYVAGGQLDLGITGRDLARDSQADVHEVLSSASVPPLSVTQHQLMKSGASKSSTASASLPLTPTLFAMTSQHVGFPLRCSASTVQ